MDLQPVISREYKLVLKADKFSGDESSILQHAQSFWSELTKLVPPDLGTIVGMPDTIDSRREIRFYDTKDVMLNKSSYIFRERTEQPDGGTEVTLKFRHPDRYISQDRNMTPRKLAGKTKFEEDIKAPFLKLYSYSTTVPVSEETKRGKVKHIIKLYPGLAEKIAADLHEENIAVVNDMTIQEIVVTGASVGFGRNAEEEAECAFIVWYGSGEKHPMIVEFSFRYGNKKERYSGAAAQCAYTLFLLIQHQMKHWISTDDATKTGFVFDK